MAQKFLTNIDLNQNQILNATFEVLASDPGSAFEGRMYYNSGDDTIRYYTGSAWKKLITGLTAGGSHTDAISFNESNGTVTITLNLADTDSAGLLSSTFWNMLNDATDDNTASKLVKRDANGNFKASDPTNSAHVATKAYVDATKQGLDVKESVRVATTAAINLTSNLEAGDTIDGVTLVAGDRVLVKNQVTASENGIYVAVASGTASRSSDADTSGKVTPGLFTFVEEGTTNGNNGFVLTTDAPVTLGTTSLVFTQFSGAGQVEAGDGLTKSGNTLNVVGTANRITVNADSVDIASTYVGQSSITTLGTIGTGTWEATDVGIAHGGTNASDEATARTNLGVKTSAGAASTEASYLARIAKQGCAASSGTTSVTTVTHKFNTTNVVVQVLEVSSGETVIGTVVRNNADVVTVTLNGSSISANDYSILVMG